MSIADEVCFLSTDVAVVASSALKRIQCAENTLGVVDAGLSSVSLVRALRLSEQHEDAELERLLLVFETAVERRLKDVKRSH